MLCFSLGSRLRGNDEGVRGNDGGISGVTLTLALSHRGRGDDGGHPPRSGWGGVWGGGVGGWSARRG